MKVRFPQIRPTQTGGRSCPWTVGGNDDIRLYEDVDHCEFSMSCGGSFKDGNFQMGFGLGFCTTQLRL